MNGAYPRKSKAPIFNEEAYKEICNMSIEDFGNKLNTMSGDKMKELSNRIPQTISTLQGDENYNRIGAGKGWEDTSIENADKLKAEWELLVLKSQAVDKRGVACSWSNNCTLKWRDRTYDELQWWDKLVLRDSELRSAQAKAGGKRRSKSSNKPKKSAKRVKTAKRSKSRKIRRQRK